jgi:hypothetical protein
MTIDWDKIGVKYNTKDKMNIKIMDGNIIEERKQKIYSDDDLITSFPSIASVRI